MSHPGFRNLVLVAAAGLALAGCDSIRKATGTGDETAAEGAVAAAATTAPTAKVGEDVEAPEAYQTSDKALWDGRPSLGGVWVAAPDVKDPQRVIMRNPSNGKSVVGALFRRERENPGPKLQLSSDAAEALGLLAGQPGTISVTALKRQEAEPAAKSTEDIGQTAGAAIDRAAAAQPAAPQAATSRSADGPAVRSATASAASAPAAASPAVAGQRLIRIGSFSKEDNARRAADRLAAGGVPARISQGTEQDKDLWSVLAGPAAPAEASAMLAKVRGLGFDDAYLLAP